MIRNYLVTHIRTSWQLSGLKYPVARFSSACINGATEVTTLNTDVRAQLCTSRKMQERARDAINRCHPERVCARGQERKINLKKKRGCERRHWLKCINPPYRQPPRCHPAYHLVPAAPSRIPHAAAGILHASRKLSCVVTFTLAARESFALLRTMEIVRREWCTDSWHGACGLRIMAGLTSNFCRHLFYRV